MTLHNPNKFMLGSTDYSGRQVDCIDGDPASFPAGRVVRRNSNGEPSLAKSDGMILGVSLGRSLSKTLRLAVCRTGNGVPIELTDDSVAASLVVGDLTFTARQKGVAGNSITIALVDGAEAGSETVDVEGNDISVNIEDGVSTAKQIADALEASEDAMALISVEISGTESNAQNAAAADNLEGGDDGFDYVVVGTKVYISDTTGRAIASGDGATVSDGLYVSGVLTGVRIDGTEVPVALVDMPGGL